MGGTGDQTRSASDMYIQSVKSQQFAKWTQVLPCMQKEDAKFCKRVDPRQMNTPISTVVSEEDVERKLIALHSHVAHIRCWS